MTASDDPTDRELLAATAGGDAAAFDRFVARHRAAVFHFARNQVGDNDAEDVLQQTFVAAWKHAADAVAERSARPWLLTIARHAAARLRRRPLAAPPRDESIEDLGERAGFAAEDARPEHFAAATEAKTVLAAAMAALPETEREVLHLREIEQLSGEDTAALLGIGLAAMKSRLHRARLHLVAEVRQRMPDEDRR